MRKILSFEKSFAFIVVGLLIFSGLGLIPTQTQAIIQNSGYNLIIIAPAYFSNDLQPLVTHKEQHAITTKIVTLDDVYNSVYFPAQGRDDAEKIKYFIKNAYDSWNISYVLFVGGRALIPLRRCSNIPQEDVPIDFTSELYYADIYDADGNFSSWDSDNDSIFGEWYNNSKAEDTQQDLTPEIGLGRLPCYGTSEVRDLVNKIIQYESTPADPSSFHTIVVAGGETFVEYPGLEGEIMTQNALDVMTGFNHVKLWYSNENLGLLGLSIVRAINKGCGFLYLAGHGNTYIWVTSNPEGKTASMFSIFHVPLLHNRGQYPICILSGCHVCKIEKSSCLGWQLTKNQKNGAIATIGPTNVGYLGFEYNGGGLDSLELQFFREYINGTTIIGDTWRQTLVHFLEMYPIDWNLPAGENCAIDAKMVQEWILIGDPSLKIGGYSS